MRQYKSHLNLQGHHPKVRPWMRHALYSVSLKVLRRLSPKVMLLCASDNDPLETMVVQMDCGNPNAWYVDTAGCAMVQANDANPPPRQGFVRTAMQYAAVLMLGLMLLVGPASCKKDPQPNPTPNVPTDTITPVIPGDTIVPPIDTIQPGGDTIVPGGDTIVPVSGGGTKECIADIGNGWHLPSVDSVGTWADIYDTIIIFIRAPDDAWTPGSFHAARDSLSRRFNISPKVRGGWGWTPYQILPDADSTNISVMGMIRSDSTQFANWGYGIYPQVSKHAKTSNPPRYNGNRFFKSGRSR